MKEMDISTPAKMQRALNVPIEQQYSREELEGIHEAIRFTQMFKAEEAKARAEETEVIERPILNGNRMSK